VLIKKRIHVSRIHQRQHQIPSLRLLVPVPLTTNHHHLPSPPAITYPDYHPLHIYSPHSVTHCLVSSLPRLQIPYRYLTVLLLLTCIDSPARQPPVCSCPWSPSAASPLQSPAPFLSPLFQPALRPPAPVQIRKPSSDCL